MADIEEDETTIAECASACVQVFQQCLSDDLLSEDDTAWTEDQLARFTIWATNIGVFAGDHASADYRLREGDQARTLILQLLWAIRENLIFISHEVEEGGEMHDSGIDEDHSPAPSTSSFTFSSDSSMKGAYVNSVPQPILEARTEVADAISRLNRLSTSIRKSGVHYRDLKGTAFVDLDEDGKNLTEYYSDLSILIVKHKFPNADETFRQCVADSLAQRRNHHAYLRRHQRKLAVRKIDEHPTPSDFLSERKITTSNPEQTRKPPQPRESRQQVLSATSASLFDPKRFNTAPRSTTSKAPSTVFLGTPSQVAALNFPPEPELAGQDFFQCRYCFLLCPAKEGSGKTWKNHVMRDIAPYICVYQDQDCSKRNDFFHTLSDWTTHIQAEHATLRWDCVAPIHDPQSFDDLEKYTDHMKQEHQDMFAGSQLRTLAQMSARPASELFEICPFCGDIPDNLIKDGLDHHHDETQNALQTHIALHLQSLSLLSLSWLYEDRSEAPSQRDSDLALEIHTEELTFHDPPDMPIQDLSSYDGDIVDGMDPSANEDSRVALNIAPTGSGGVSEWAFINSPLLMSQINHGGDEFLAQFIEKYRERETLNLPNAKSKDPNVISPELLAILTEKIKKEVYEELAKARILTTQADDHGKSIERGQGSSDPETLYQDSPDQYKPSDVFQKHWGRLIDFNGRPTQRLGQFLRGIANYMIKDFEPRRSIVVQAVKMAKFYADYRLEKEPHPLSAIFSSQSHKSICQLFQDLGCQHHLVQEISSPPSTTPPVVPALTANGFAHWMTLLILAYPDEESERLEMVLQSLPIDADDSYNPAGPDLPRQPERLPKTLPRSLLPKRPNLGARILLDGAIGDLLVSFGVPSRRDVEIPRTSRIRTPRGRPQADSPRPRYF